MKIAIVGFGNVGYHLAKKFITIGEDLVCIYNRSRFELPPFVQASDVSIIHDIAKLPEDLDLCILAVVDDVVQQVADTLPKHIKSNSIIAHTSGVHGLEVFNEDIIHTAFFYPLNSFSRENSIDWFETPIFLTAMKEDEGKLKSLASNISNQIYLVDSKQKAVLHACAVIVNNFPNALFQMADQILKDHNLELTPLLPLIKTTAQKVQEVTPEEAQTGPAKRADRMTIEKHLKILQAYPFEKQVYQLLSHYINPKLKQYEDD